MALSNGSNRDLRLRSSSYNGSEDICSYCPETMFLVAIEYSSRVAFQSARRTRALTDELFGYHQHVSLHNRPVQ